jgi:cell division septum initiation protein DivIVA
MDNSKNILTNPKDMAEFLQIVESNLAKLKENKIKALEQVDQIQNNVNEHENTLATLKNWQEIMVGDDLTLIKMAYTDIKKGMTDIKTT